MPEIDPSSEQEVWGNASFRATGGALAFVVADGRVAFVEEADDGTDEVLVVDVEVATLDG